MALAIGTGTPRAPTVPVFAAVDGDDVLRGVEEPFAAVRPGQRAWGGIGVEFHSEAQALALLNVGPDRTQPSIHGDEPLIWRDIGKHT